MESVVLVIHLILALAIIGLVLLQRSEGGGLGMGGGGGGNSLMSGRGAAGALVRTTIIIGGLFFVTSLALTSIANRDDDGRSAVEMELGAEEINETTAPVDLFDPSAPLLDGQDGGSGALPAVTDEPIAPSETVPAAPDGASAIEETPVPAEPDTGNPQ